MWNPLRKNGDAGPIDSWSFAAFVVAFVSLCAAAGVARWSWLLLDEQVALRKEVMKLRSQQEQVHIQYERWLQKVQQEREAKK